MDWVKCGLVKKNSEKNTFIWLLIIFFQGDKLYWNTNGIIFHIFLYQNFFLIAIVLFWSKSYILIHYQVQGSINC